MLGGRPPSLVIAQDLACAHAAAHHPPSTGHRHLAHATDPLSVGPLVCARARGGEVWRRFARMRDQYWRSTMGEACSPAEWPWFAPSVVRHAGDVVIATRTDANGWLVLAMVLSLCARSLPPSRRLVLWCAVNRARHCGAFAPDPPRPLSPSETSDALRLWQLVTSPTPVAASLVERSSRLRPAADALLDQLPDAATGLTVHELRILEACAAGPTATRRALGQVLIARPESGGVVPPMVLAHRVRRLTDRRAPALEASDEPDEWDRTLTLTDFGHALLAGRADLLAALGLDETVGGVRQCTATGRIWVREPEGRVRERAVGGPA